MTADPALKETAALAVRGLTKSYGGVRALVGFDLTVSRGEVHALIGQNGCGKSTFIKSMTGVLAPESGDVLLFGRPLALPVADPHRHGIAVIHQDIGLVDTMSVLDNLGVSARFGTRLLRPVPMRRERHLYQHLMARLAIRIDLDARVATLSPAERALVAVLRALRLMDDHTADQLFVLDEPTAALSGPQAAVILSLMRRVADLGSAVVFVSHRLTEVTAACDTVTVMRDGRDVVTSPVAETTRSEMVGHMLGRRMDEFFPEPPPVADSRARLVLDGITGGRVHGVSLAVRAGEVVGVTGLAGMGQEELLRLVTGIDVPAAGRCVVDGEARRFATPGQAIAAGVALVPGNRLRDGLWLTGTVEENVTLPVVADLSSPLRLARTPLRDLARRLVTDFRVRTAGIHADMSSLSGGNQQKIVFAKWLQRAPGVLFLDEPTQGVDPGAARDLLEAAMDLAAGGSAVVIVSGDHEMLAAICHRVVVLHHGRLTAEIHRPQLDEKALVEACETPAEAVSW